MAKDKNTVAENVHELSVAELQQILKQRQARVTQLEKRREKLQESLQEIEREIQEIAGVESTGTGVRPRNQQSLEKVISEILAKNKKGLTLQELADAVEKSGYQSSSNNFKNVIYQNVYKSELIVRDEKTGKYVLA